MPKRFSFIFGIALIVGVAYGKYTEKTRYYLMLSNRPKREITISTYREYKNDFNYKNDVSFETFFNTQNACLGGVASFGVLLILNSLIDGFDKFKKK